MVSTRRLDLVFPRFKLLSGAERAILGLAGGLVDLGHRVRVVCHQFDPSCRERLPAAATLVSTDVRLDWSRNRYLNAVSDYARVAALRQQLDPTADLHLLFGPSLPLVGLPRARRRVPALYYCWEPPRALFQDRDAVLERLGGWRPVVGPLLGAYRGVDRWLVGRADALCTSSPFAAHQIERAYGRPAEVITLGVDRDRLDGVAPSREAERPTVVTVNYLHPRKRVDLIVRAAAACRADWPGPGPSPRWVIVGGGPERERLERLAAELGVTAEVELTGFVPDAELPKYYATASCYVHAALEESFGLSVIEAAYAGCPVVAVDEGGVQETVVDGETGRLVSPRPERLAAAVRDVLLRPDRGAALGRAGRERVGRTYRWERGAAQVIRLVDQLNA